MDSRERFVISLEEGSETEESRIGGKAARLASLLRAGYRVPPGLCVTTSAYERFLSESTLEDVIRTELGRKPIAAMRWEEVWDTALRIRSAFLGASIPTQVSQEILDALSAIDRDMPLVVRSSAPGEDSAQRSFAGLHESFGDIRGEEEVLQAVRRVWASLWSDAALLYRRELGLDPARSRMAVLIQPTVLEDRSGVAFGRDPRAPQLDRVVIEAVAGPCSLLVDGLRKPDHWLLERATGTVLEWLPGEDSSESGAAPLLQREDLVLLRDCLQSIEGLLHWPPDVEWTGRAEQFTVLQARPVTGRSDDGEDEREWYLSLRPRSGALRDLCRRVTEELIPRLEEEGEQFAAERLDGMTDSELAEAIERRAEALTCWRDIYRKDFIPFAHGVRRLGLYYNDAVRPEDPYEFVGLLRGQEMLAARRNRTLVELAEFLAGTGIQIEEIRKLLQADDQGREPDWDSLAGWLGTTEEGREFLSRFQSFLVEFMDNAFRGERLLEQPAKVLASVVELTVSPVASRGASLEGSSGGPDPRVLERRLLDAVGRERAAETREVLSTARLSWRLRDDDNILLGRVESQMLRALQAGEERLRAQGRLEGAPAGESLATEVAEALRDSGAGTIQVPPAESRSADMGLGAGESPRQIVGQPAAPGVATGRARKVETAADLAGFRAGEILVCDAIQPVMTHLVPLAAAVVERRGGMLIHGAIIARELGIPCVNGVPEATRWISDGDLVTVDGFLGIVTVGEAEFEMERGA